MPQDAWIFFVVGIINAGLALYTIRYEPHPRFPTRFLALSEFPRCRWANCKFLCRSHHFFTPKEKSLCFQGCTIRFRGSLCVDPPFRISTSFPLLLSYFWFLLLSVSALIYVFLDLPRPPPLDFFAYFLSMRYSP